MVSLYVEITDYDWFRFLSTLQSVEKVNFWQPGGRTNFKALQPGELFLFKAGRRTSVAINRLETML